MDDYMNIYDLVKINGDIELFTNRPDMGKTMLLLQLAAKLSADHKKVYIISLASNTMLLERKLAQIGCDSDSITIVDNLYKIKDVVNYCSSLENGSFAFIDYLQLLVEEEDGGDYHFLFDSLCEINKKSNVKVRVFSEVANPNKLIDAYPDINSYQLDNKNQLLVEEQIWCII